MSILTMKRFAKQRRNKALRRKIQYKPYCLTAQRYKNNLTIDYMLAF